MSRRRSRIAAFSDLAPEQIDRAIRTSRAAVAGLFLQDQTNPASEGSFDFCKRGVLSQRQQRYSGSFRNGQLEVASSGKADQRIADQRRLWASVHELATFGLPSSCWF